MLEVVKSKYAQGSNGSYKAVRVNANTKVVRNGEVFPLNPTYNYYVQWDVQIDKESNMIYSSGYSVSTFNTLKEVDEFLATIH